MLRNKPKHIAAIIWYRAIAELKSESARALIGLLWWIAEPILYMLVFYFVFSVGFRMGGPDFVPFLLTGLVAWKWFASSIQSNTNVFLTNQGLISQVDLPKYTLVLTNVLTATLKFAAIFSMLILFLLYSGYRPVFNWIYIIPLFVVLAMLATGISAIVAAITPFVPELKLITDNGIMLLFFMSGIFFDISERSVEVQEILLLNPMASWLINFRHVMLDGGVPNWGSTSVVGALGLVLLTLGILLLGKLDRKIARVSV